MKLVLARCLNNFLLPSFETLLTDTTVCLIGKFLLLLGISKGLHQLAKSLFFVLTPFRGACFVLPCSVAILTTIVSFDFIRSGTKAQASPQIPFQAVVNDSENQQTQSQSAHHCDHDNQVLLTDGISLR